MSKEPGLIEIEQLDSPDMVIEFINESTEHLDVIEESILELETRNKDKVLINDIFRPFHSMKGIAGFTGLPIVSGFAHDTETILDMARNDKLTINADIVQTLLTSVDIIKEMLRRITEKVEKPDTEIFYPDFETHSQALSVIALNPPLEVAKAVTEDVSTEELSEEAKKARLEASMAKATQQPTAAGTKLQEEIRVRLDKVNTLINLVGELVISQAMLSGNQTINQLEDKALTKELNYIEKTTKDIQDISMSLRMVNLHSLYQKLQRLVRDLTKALGKKAKFVTIGEETEVDRSVIELINDPLVHILRNSLDHGLEIPENRGDKEAEGLIELKAYQQGENIVIQIIDDGAGMDAEKLIRLAIEKGVIESKEDLKDMNPLELIFAPGFSTAKEVTNVSGRGVGMDVVRRNIDSLRGKIYVESEMGKGTTITIRLPLTMAIIDGMIVRVENERFIIPTLAILESFQPKKDDVFTVESKGEVVKLREEVFPVNRISNLFKISKNNPPPEESLLILIESGGQKACILVDELMGKQQVVIKNLGETLNNVKGILGASVLADGKVGLIINTEEIIILCGHN